MKPFIATPAYAGNVCVEYLAFLLQLQRNLLQSGINPTIANIVGSCFVAWSREDLATAFLKTDCTHLIFIDADMGFDVDDFLQMLAYAEKPEYQVIGAGYPSRVFDWEHIKKTILENPEIEPSAIPKMGQRWTVQTVEQQDDFTLDKPLEVLNVATGGLVIQRNVFEKLQKPYFDMDWNNGDRLGEDFRFCREWRNAGGKVWMAPWVKSVHVGRHPFIGDLSCMA